MNEIIAETLKLDKEYQLEHGHPIPTEGGNIGVEDLHKLLKAWKEEAMLDEFREEDEEYRRRRMIERGK